MLTSFGRFGFRPQGIRGSRTAGEFLRQPLGSGDNSGTMTTSPIPNDAQLIPELAELCRVGYEEGTATSLRRMPGLIGLIVAGGPGLPRDLLGWHERRESLRAILREIAAAEVVEELGDEYGRAARQLFRLDPEQPLHHSQHRRLNEIQEELSEDFGGAPTSRRFLNKHRPLLFKVIAKALIARETEAQKQAGEDADKEPPTEHPVTPTALTDADADRSRRPRKGRRRLLLASAILVAVVLAWLVSGTPTPESGERLPAGRQIADGVPQPGVVRMLRRAHLRDAATPSYFVVVRHPPPKPRLRSWDEIRVYDNDGSDAALGLVAQPVALVGGAPTVAFHGVRWGKQTGRMYRFALLGVHDVDGDGRAEIYGAFSDQISSVTRPFAIEWDDATHRYGMVPLIQGPPKAPIYDPGRPVLSVASWAHRESRTALKVYVAPEDRHVMLYGANETAIRRVPSLGWLFISGYAASSKSVRASYEAHGQQQTGRGANSTYRFAFGKSPEIALLTVEVARLQRADGLIEPVPCRVYASHRVRPGLVVPSLMVNALAADPLASEPLSLTKHAYCPA
jgi:hypothetical protein